MELIYALAKLSGAICSVAACAALLIRPVRDRALGLADIREGMKCQLRSDLLRTYYRHREEGRIRQYEYENFLACYKAYKALGGNSFIDRICREVEEWEIVS